MRLASNKQLYFYSLGRSLKWPGCNTFHRLVHINDFHSLTPTWNTQDSLLVLFSALIHTSAHKEVTRTRTTA